MATSTAPRRPALKQWTADLLFVLQLVITGVFGGSEFLRLLTTSQGVNLSWLIFWLAFLLINLALTIRAHRAKASRVTIQTIGSYAAWTVVIAADVAVLLVKGTDRWDNGDTVTAAAVGVGLIISLLLARRWGRGLTDPMVHGMGAVCFIGLPQLTLAYKIFTEGGGGLAGPALLASNIGILIRLVQLALAIAEAGWDENRQGAALGEGANEISWLLITAAWLSRWSEQ